MNNTSTSSVRATNKLIPELRFPEFANEGDWEEKTLDAVCEINPRVSQLPEQFVYIDLESVENGTLLQKKFLRSDGAPSRAQRHLKENDVIFQMVRPYQKNNYYFFKNDDFDYVASTGYAQLRSFESSMYLYQFIHTDRFVANVLEKCTGSNYPAINSSDLSQILVQIPKPKEQQKIASCLSSLDEVIAAHNQKLEALRDHKKGLMQNLFPQERETVPKYRFKEFKEDGDWLEKSLDEVATFLKGKGISKSDIVKNGSLPCIRYGELYTHYIETIRIIKSYTNLNPADLVLSKANDVIIPASGETQIDIATASCVLEKGIALGGDLNIIRTKINGVFLTYYLNNVKRMDIAQMAQGISVVHLYPNQLKTLMINIPKPNEQQKIADCFSSLDNLITVQVENIEQLKLHKKGLMQGLFPGNND